MLVAKKFVFVHIFAVDHSGYEWTIHSKEYKPPKNIKYKTDQTPTSL